MLKSNGRPAAREGATATEFRIGETPIERGRRRVVHLPIAALYSHDAPLTLPVHVIRGHREGPVMFVSAAIHGDELNGVEIIRRLLRHTAVRRLKGTLLAIPVVNGFGMLQHSRYLPDRRDLNRSFPGSVSGSLGARLAHLFVREIIDRSDVGVDLHTGAQGRKNLPQVRANLDDAHTRELAQAFGVPVVIHSATRDGSLREVAAERGVKMLLFEAGESLRFDELSIRAGLQGVLRLMRHVGMIPPGRPQAPVPPFIARSSSWVRAPSSGMVNLRKRLGEYVDSGDLVARIFDPYDLFNAPALDVVTDYQGVVVGINNNPLIHEGDALMHIARYKRGEDVAEGVEAAHQYLLDGPVI